MNVLLSFTREPRFDIQKDVHLERGEVVYSEGPDRAYLRLAGSEELIALWEIDTPDAGSAIAAALGAGLPAGSEVRPFDLSWVRNGQLAVSRRAIGADVAMWLFEALAAENCLDYAAHVFGGQAVDQG